MPRNGRWKSTSACLNRRPFDYHFPITSYGTIFATNCSSIGGLGAAVSTWLAWGKYRDAMYVHLNMKICCFSRFSLIFVCLLLSVISSAEIEFRENTGLDSIAKSTNSSLNRTYSVNQGCIKNYYNFYISLVGINNQNEKSGFWINTFWLFTLALMRQQFFARN